MWGRRRPHIFLLSPNQPPFSVVPNDGNAALPAPLASPPAAVGRGYEITSKIHFCFCDSHTYGW